MENTTGPIKVFLVGKLPQEKYTDINEFAKDLANILAIDAKNITVDLIALETLKGEKGDDGARGPVGAPGSPGIAGPTGASSGVLSSYVALADSATITWNALPNAINQNAKVTLAGSRTLVIAGAIDGMSGTLIITQDGVGSRTLTLPAGSLQAGGAITLTTTPAGIDKLNWTYNGTNFFWTADLAFS